MRTFFLQILGLFIVIVIGLLISTNQSFIKSLSGFILFRVSPSAPAQTSRQASPGNILKILDSSGQAIKATVNIELADTKEEKTKGLSGVTGLEQNQGLLFTYDKPEIHKFWMKGMKIPLDFIWIRGNEVVDLLPNIPPPELGQADQTLPLYASVTPVDKVLEVKAGFIAKNNIQPGDKINY